MGGRGARSARVRIPKINNPVGIPSNAITEDEFLGLRGVRDVSSGWVIDKLRGNRQLKTERGEKRFIKEAEMAEKTYQEKRNKAKQEYKKLVAEGKIRDKTPVEKRLVKAHGHPDLEATHASRRMLAKMGIDWKTGKKLKK